MTSTFTIGQLAAAAGVNVETIRYYERRGLVPVPARPASGYRHYTDQDLWRLQFIGRASSWGSRWPRSPTSWAAARPPRW